MIIPLAGGIVKMRILITNDDGFESDGIRALVEELQQDHELVLAAPYVQQSAKGHGVSFFSDLSGEKREYPGTKEAWAIRGTPADCAYLGITCIMKDQAPDLIISGINHGANVSLDNIYSGTVAAATEGRILGCPSMAVSLDMFQHATLEDFRPSAHIAHTLIQQYLDDPNCCSYTLSINVPVGTLEELKGYKITDFDPRRAYQRGVEMIDQPDGSTVFHSTAFDCTVEGGTLPKTGDIAALQQGYVSLTPIGIDWVDHLQAEKMKAWKLSQAH